MESGLSGEAKRPILIAGSVHMLKAIFDGAIRSIGNSQCILRQDLFVEFCKTVRSRFFDSDLEAEDSCILSGNVVVGVVGRISQRICPDPRRCARKHRRHGVGVKRQTRRHVI